MGLIRPVLSLAVAVGLAAVSDGAVAAAGPGVPPVSDAARAAGFVDVRSVVPDAIIDLRYATTNNFTRTQLYPSDARCLVHQSMSQGLAAAAAAMRPQGHVLVFWDCYRPHDVQVRMFNVVPNPAWVARPGPYAHSHESGRSVDVTFTSVQQQCPPERVVGGQTVDFAWPTWAPTSTTSRSRATAFATQGRQCRRSGEPRPAADAMNYGGLSRVLR